MTVFIELTNPIHGGEGWELGEVLWSPVASAWNKIMKKPQEGDLILHSIKDKKRNINHRLWGISTVAGPYKIVSDPPPIPEAWEGYESYYQIPLKHYKEIKEKTFLQDFIDKNEKSLKELIPQKSFYTESGTRMQPAQKYLAQINDELFRLITPYLEIIFYDEEPILNSENIVREGDIEEQISTGKKGQPERIKTMVNRIIRDTALIKRIKSKYNNQCQICGENIKLPNGKYYSEGHHLKKLGGIHQGPDVEENIIILCPNHHVEFDYGIIAIDPSSKKVIHKNKENAFYDKRLAYERSNLSEKFLTYHLEKIFMTNL
ncbi:HNH endonuclease [Enterococcus thailandicus]|uniref:HNH endonuclease n=1 Tax=Enterococcus TaxID=1350 RepID=UPI00094D5498|nr:HNH endonuclease [Enterococcus thailandicus]